jgi:hypothetical protein
MKPKPHGCHRLIRRLGLILITAGLAAGGSEGPASDTPKEPLPADSKVHSLWEGGVDPRPILTGITTVEEENQLLLKWSGLSGPYRVERSATLTGGWEPVGDATPETSLSVALDGSLGIFRIQAPRPDYIGDTACRGCHRDVHDGWLGTVHRGAFETLARIGQGANSQCLPCHTVGFGLPGGFVSIDTTPRLAGVQCENCHGPAANHAADPGNLSARPVISLSGLTCGGCHTGFHHPTYHEWVGEPHGRKDPHVADGFLNEDVAAAEARMRSCGPCHSGAVRLALLNAVEEGNPNPQLPSGDHAANTPITCAVCHTAHEATEFGSQLRNPTYSTEFFSYSTSANTDFAKQYNPRINLCGQCHNARGARWEDTSRPPHHSVQYNMLVGAIGFEVGTPTHSTHRDLAKQCTHCHTHSHGPETPSEEVPVYTGHSFRPLPENCTPCHTPEEAEAFITFRQRTTRAQIAEVKLLLDTWGETASPEPLRTQYGKLTWEYNNAGQLSLAEDGSALRGPTNSEQTLIPNEIKQARFLLYMVEHDGSYGAHNARYATHLLNEAKKLVEARITMTPE